MKRTRIRPVSSKRRQRDASYPKQREAVFERGGGVCEFSGWDWATNCHRPMVDVHHIAGRGGKDPHRLSNLIGLCREHHAKAHEDPEWAYEVGLMRHRNGKDAA